MHLHLGILRQIYCKHCLTFEFIWPEFKLPKVQKRLIKWIIFVYTKIKHNNVFLLKKIHLKQVNLKQIYIYFSHTFLLYSTILFKLLIECLCFFKYKYSSLFFKNQCKMSNLFKPCMAYFRPNKMLKSGLRKIWDP